MNNNIENVSWETAKESGEYHYSGNANTLNEISDKFQIMATNNINGMERNIVKLQYKDYTCDLDIFWEDVMDNTKFHLVIELFVDYENGTINCSEELLISDIYRPNYLENKMFQFIIESMDLN